MAGPDDPTATLYDFATALADNDIDASNIYSPDGERVVAHVMPADLERADELAAEHGFERVDGELDRRIFEPVDA